MNDSTVLIAAMRGEVSPLVHRWAALGTESGVDGWHHPSAPVLVLYGGMGANAVTRAFSRALQLARPIAIWSVGWAGALQAGTEAGSVLWPSAVRDLRTGESFLTTSGTGLLLTSPLVATHAEKDRLSRTYGGSVAVDMEAATLARLSTAHGIPFRAAKAVSDTLEEQLPDMNAFVRDDGSFATARFVLSAAMQPRSWAALSRFGRQARLAAANLCDALERELGV